MVGRIDVMSKSRNKPAREKKKPKKKPKKEPVTPQKTTGPLSGS